jgi:hypothetical protein
VPALKMRIDYESAEGPTSGVYDHHGDQARVTEQVAESLATGKCLVAHADDGTWLVIPAVRVLNVAIAPA